LKTTVKVIAAGGLVLAGLLLLSPAAPVDAWAQRPAYPIRQAAPAVSAYPPADPYELGLRADQIALLRRTLDAAPAHGLSAAAFVAPDLDQRLTSRDAATRLDGQRLLVAAIIRYAQAVHVGRLAPSAFMADWSVRPEAYNAAAEYQAALAQNRLAAWIDDLPPPYAGYTALQQGLAAYRRIDAAGGWPTIPAGPVMKLGVLDSRVALLRARLAAEDRTVSPAGDVVFDAGLAQGVMRAQKRFGLEPTGAVDAATRNALNTSVDERIGQIVANMERWRWLPAALPADRIQVNIAAAVLTVFRGDTPTMSMRAVTGKPGDETPMLRSVIHSVVLNPPWNVPTGIATKELIPKGQDYLARNGFSMIPTSDGGYRLQQKAGPQSALGRMKFDFDNPYAVYLHDTPTKATFERYGRLASHGCVRLEKAEQLTRALMEGDPVWTSAAIDQTLAAGQTVRVPLSRPVAVFLLYWTAYLAPDGQMNFRADPYGWDRELLKRIGGAAV
jgi:murein L,D-transpeptidase YcbB/YkuD